MLKHIFEQLLNHKWSGDIKLGEQVIYCPEYRITQISSELVQLSFNTTCNPLLSIKVFDFLHSIKDGWDFKVGASYYIDEVNQVNFINSILDKELLA